ncbi:hypothetical protein COOONC_11375 [Cooperia oncophora]
MAKRGSTRQPYKFFGIDSPLPQAGLVFPQDLAFHAKWPRRLRKGEPLSEQGLVIANHFREAYVCTSVPLDPESEHYITGYKPQVEAKNAHHILLFGCEEPGSDEEVW